MTVEARFVRVRGRVQGVGFRYFALDTAQQHGIAGWVRNTADGDVEIVAQGAPNNLERFLEQVKDGPRLSRVDDISVSPHTTSDEMKTFRVRY